MDLFILMGLPLVPKAEEKISMYEPGALLKADDQSRLIDTQVRWKNPI